AQAVLAVVVRRTARTQAVARAADSVKAFADLVERHPVLDFGGRFGRSEACPSAGLRSMSNGWGASGTMRSGASPLVPCRRIHSVSSGSVLRGRWLMGDLLSRLGGGGGSGTVTPPPGRGRRVSDRVDLCASRSSWPQPPALHRLTPRHQRSG